MLLLLITFLSPQLPVLKLPNGTVATQSVALAR